MFYYDSIRYLILNAILIYLFGRTSAGRRGNPTQWDAFPSEVNLKSAFSRGQPGDISDYKSFERTAFYLFVDSTVQQFNVFSIPQPLSASDPLSLFVLKLKESKPFQVLTIVNVVLCLSVPLILCPFFLLLFHLG